MKKVKIMFFIILTVAVVAAAFAFKAQKASGFCVYQTTFTTTAIEEDPVHTCKTLGQYKPTAFPQGSELDGIFTVAGTTCATLPIFTPTIYCTRNDVRISVE